MTPREVFLSLVRLGIGCQASPFKSEVDWTAVESLAKQQGLLSVLTDGVDSLPLDARPPKEVLLQFIGQVMQDESRYAVQQKTAVGMALLFHENYIGTYVLKGYVVAECYPRPEHRVCSDMDCFLFPEKGNFDAWSLGNDLIRSNGYDVSIGFYKNSTFHLPDLIVENHKYLTPFRGNRRLKELEKYLQSQLIVNKEKLKVDRFEGTWLYRPPVMVTALFLIEHAYSHFLHEGLTWRQILDWMMFSRKHKNEIDWKLLDTLIDEFGLRKFYDTYNRIGQYLLGEIDETEFSKRDKRMLEDIWSELDLHDTTEGLKGKLNLVGNVWRARWKYHYFSEISMLHALWIQAQGVLFIKNPTLD